MKKLTHLLVLGATVGFMAFMANYVYGAYVHPHLDVRSAVLIDADGEIYYELNGDMPMPPASMSKMMTELIVLDAVASGQHQWNEKVRTSRYASEVIGAQIGLTEGETVTLEELFKAMAIQSANDAAVAIAEHLAGSEDHFVQWMNEKAKEIGLSDGTRFVNATGLSSSDLGPYRSERFPGETVMTAMDTAKLAAHLIGTHPDILETTKLTTYQLSHKEVQVRATNWMLPGEAYAYPGNDGLKTGYTEQAGYCFAGTSQQGSKRLIAVVMGANSIEGRFHETAKLFRYGFKPVLL